MPNEIRHKKLLAVEGKDETKFFESLLKHLGIEDFEIYDVGGEKQFKNKLPGLVKVSGFKENVEVLAIIRDAETDARARFDSVCGVLREIKIEPPTSVNSFTKGKPRVGIYLMPGNLKDGMLEDLCSKTVADHEAMNCVEMFSGCVEELGEKPKNMAKARAQVFLAAMPEIVNSVGLGALKQYWNFNSNELTDLIKFLSNLK